MTIRGQTKLSPKCHTGNIKAQKMARFTDKQKLACAERELRWRHKVYSSRIKRGQMSHDQAKQEILLMQDIADDYRERMAAEPTLFGNMARAPS